MKRNVRANILKNYITKVSDFPGTVHPSAASKPPIMKYFLSSQPVNNFKITLTSPNFY